MAAPTLTSLVNLPTRSAPDTFNTYAAAIWPQFNNTVTELNAFSAWLESGVDVALVAGVEPVTIDNDTDNTKLTLRGARYTSLKIDAERSGAEYSYRPSIIFGVPITGTADGATKDGAAFISCFGDTTRTQAELVIGTEVSGDNYDPTATDPTISGENGCRIYVGQTDTGYDQISFRKNGTHCGLFRTAYNANLNTGVSQSIVTRANGDLRYAPISSAARLKENIQDMPPADLSALGNYSWTWGGELPDDAPTKGKVGSGLLADEVVALFPQAGIYDADGRLEGYNPQPVVGALVDTIKRLDGALDGLLKRIEAIEG